MEKYIFLDFDGVLNTPKGKFDQKAIGTNRHFRGCNLNCVKACS